MSDKVTTAYKNYAPQAQQQTLPGKDTDMDPLAEHSKVEMWSREGEPYLAEYRGSGVLQTRDGSAKAALITGGDSGIGRSVAIGFAREGANITINYLKEEQEDAEKTKKLVEESGRKCLLFPGDLRDHTTRKALLEAHLKEYQYLDVLVNNASQQIQCQDIAEIDMKNVEDTFQVNIVGMIGMAKEAVPHMKRGSLIINTTSVTAYKGSAGMLDYSATKGAIAAFTRSLALQLLPKGIRVNGVAPGPVFTPLQPASRPAEQMEDWGVGDVPLWGRVAQPAEMISSYVYLCNANVVSGSIVHPNSSQHFIA